MASSTWRTTHAGVALEFIDTPAGPRLLGLLPAGAPSAEGRAIPTSPLRIAVAGHHIGMNDNTVSGVTAFNESMTLLERTQTADMLELSYIHAETGLKATVRYEWIPGAAVVRSVVTAQNTGDEPVVLTHLASAFCNGLGSDGLRAWWDPQRFLVHYCRQVWEGEGQWRSGTLEDLGLYPVSCHPDGGAVHLHTVGSDSTARFLPMLVVEDRETGHVWYMQIEPGASWHLEIGAHSGWDGSPGTVFLQADAADERYLGWTLTLNPGESFVTAPAAMGCCAGGFEEAVRQLTRYRRTLKPQPAWDGEMPVMYNDYMNALWGQPTREKLIPLIDAAARVGVDVFTIDAGWFSRADKPWNHGLGDWAPSPDRFGPDGVPGLLNIIRERGMIPGIWLELEVCAPDSDTASQPDDWFLMRNGRRVFSNDRLFFNFTNPAVCDHLHRVIDRLVEMGVGFIKNDYNQCVGLGADNIASSAAAGLTVNHRAFMRFIDEVRARHPRLILENCGSGAMREEYALLSHFHIQSYSDQEYHYMAPSVLMGGLAGVLPEQLGIWSTPWPLLFLQMSTPEVLSSDAYRQQMADGEQTVFNMVNGLCGTLYLSGRIEYADDFNLELIRKGVTAYREERAFIRQAYPFWPTGWLRITDRHGWGSVGLADETYDRALLAVWRLQSHDELFTIPLPRFAGRSVDVSLRYPADFPCDWHFAPSTGLLTVRLPKQDTARMLEIRVR